MKLAAPIQHQEESSSSMSVIQKTKNRGKSLEKRLKILNQYLLSPKKEKISRFLGKKGMTVESFAKRLPPEYRFQKINEVNPNTIAGKAKLISYINDLNLLYATQFLRHGAAKQESNADGEEYLNAKGGKGFLGIRNIGRSVITTGKGAIDGVKTVVNSEKDFLDDKKKWKKQLANGEITQVEYDNLLKTGKKTRNDGIKDGIKNGINNSAGLINKFNPATVVMRASFGALIDFNAANMAYQLGRIKDENDTHWKKTKNTWIAVGGDTDSLSKMIERGRGKKPFLGIGKGKGGQSPRSADGEGEEYNMTGAEVPAALAEAAGIIAMVLPIIKSFKKNKGEPVTDEETIDLPTSTLDPETQRLIDKLNKEGDGGDGGDDSVDAGGVMKHLKKNWYWYASGFTLATIVTLFLVLKKK